MLVVLDHPVEDAEPAPLGEEVRPLGAPLGAAAARRGGGRLLSGLAQWSQSTLRFIAELILRWFEAVPGCPGESQDKGKEAQEGFRRARGTP